MDLGICFGLSFFCKMRIILFCVQGCFEVHVTKLFVDKPQKESQWSLECVVGYILSRVPVLPCIAL